LKNKLKQTLVSKTQTSLNQELLMTTHWLLTAQWTLKWLCKSSENASMSYGVWQNVNTS